MIKLSQLLSDLIKIESATREGANQAVDFCKDWLVQHGLFVKEFVNNGYKMLVCEIGTGEKTLIWNGHVDVVSGKPFQFEPYIKDGNMYGRGAADMKAGVAAMMCAMEELKHEELDCKVQLQIVSDEEIGGFNCSAYLADQGFRGDFVVCSEPTQLGIGLQAKGILQLDIEVEGSSAHGSRPWEGKNAILEAFQVFERILELPFVKEASEFYPFPSINLSKIHGGEVYNKVPDSCVMSLDIRFLPSQTKEVIIRQIQSITEGAIRVHMYGEPVRTRKQDPYIEELVAVMKNMDRFDDVEIFGQHGSADTRFFSKYGIPAIEFGPTGAHWHGDEEYVALESVEVYKNILIKYARTIN